MKNFIQRFLNFLSNRLFQVGVLIIMITFNLVLAVVTWPYIKLNILHWDDSVKIQANAPKNVVVKKVIRTSISSSITVNGTIRSKDTVEISSEISGRVKSIHFHQGDSVKKGDLLIQLEDEEPLAKLQEALAGEKLHLATFQRKEKMFNTKNEMWGGGYGSKAELDKASAELEMAKASVITAKVHVRHTRILAPQDGRIGLCDLSIGSSVQPNQLITRIVRSDVLAVDLSVSESDAAHMQAGQEVSVSIDANHAPRPATIQAIEPYSDPVAHMTRVRALLDNKDSQLTDGTFVKVTIPLAKEEDALVVSDVSIIKDGDQNFVFVVINGRAVMQPVAVGLKQDDTVQILEGLSEGELVVTDSPEHMVNNMPVVIIREE